MLLNKVQWCSESSQYKNFLSVEWLESLILNSRLRSSALAAAVVVIVLIVVYRSSPSQSTDFFPPHCFKLSPHTHGSQYAKISCKKKGSNVQDSRLKLLSKFQVVSRQALLKLEPPSGRVFPTFRGGRMVSHTDREPMLLSYSGCH